MSPARTCDVDSTLSTRASLADDRRQGNKPLAEEFRLRYRSHVLALRLLTLLAAAAQVSCAGTIERVFDEHDYAFPIHVDLQVQHAALGYPGTRCEDAPGRRGEIEALLQRIDRRDIHAITDRFCVPATAKSVSQPFLVARQTDDGADLGLHIRCYGQGRVNGLDLLTMPDDVANESVESARALDNWLYRRGNGEYWILENVLVFGDVSAPSGATVRFKGLLETWDDSDEMFRINRIEVLEAAPFNHPLAIMSSCGS